jgi:hypothetical protein
MILKTLKISQILLKITICLICLEINDNSDNNCIRIQNQLYTKECLCDGWVHEYCLDIWYVKNNKCPICLSIMNKNQLNELNIIIPEQQPLTIFNRNNFILVINFAFSAFFLFYLFLVLSSILKLL